ncbi:MAG TPA: hypothetical protein VKT77_19895, partial [Chthonomonadaceae bacterium]|nr:hypothetical protein [Chthonomonadaceae bacterium]
MRTLLLLGIGAVAAGLAAYAAVSRENAPLTGIEISHQVRIPVRPVGEAAPSVGLCPWRTPDADRLRYFPGSLSSRDESLILSRQRLALKDRLGRTPLADDNAIIVHRILGPEGPQGVVVTRRVRGECGLIELVLATDSQGRVVGAKLQRHREPEATARALDSPSWLGAFRGKDCCSPWTLGRDIPAVPAEARISAEAVLREA